MKINLKHYVLLGFGLVVLYLLFWPSEKDHLNAQMAELCKKNGGVKIYETVKLPPEMFDEYGMLRNRKSVKENGHYVSYFGSDYALVEEVLIIKNGDPTKGQGLLLRGHNFIRRVSSNKILGEAVQYGRAGGDRWSAGMHSQSQCSDEPIDLVNKVFNN